MAKTPTGNSGNAVDPLIGEPGPGKGHATPSRREQEAANLRPLVSNDRKAANRSSRAQVAESRERARIGLANGEEKYLTIRDRGPQRRFVRDYVDARFSVGEALIPVMFLFILSNFLPVTPATALIVIYGFVIVAVLDCVLVGFILNKKLAAKFGASQVQRGFRWYAAMRALQLRPLRLPKPQVKRRQYPS